MRKNIVAAIIVLCIVGISLGLALTFKMWGYGIFPGYIKVSAYTQDPTTTGSTSQNPVIVQVSCDGKLLGNSDTQFQVTSGERIISFATFSSDYETPSTLTVVVKPYETTYVTALYPALHGYLVVETILHDNYYQNSSNINAVILVDGQDAGSGHICWRLNSSDLGSHIISFAEVVGYHKPANRSVSVNKATTVKITGTYEKILTAKQEVYVFCRSRVADAYAKELNATSKADTDNFKQRILDEMITTPTCFVAKFRAREGELWYDSEIGYYVARYAGVSENDLIMAAEDIFYRLNSCGIDLRSVGSMWKEHNRDSSKYIVVVKLDFEIRYINVENNIYKFKEEDIDALPDLSSTIEITGIGLCFSQTRQVYVQTNSGMTTFEQEYVPPFTQYESLEENEKGWWWEKHWYWIFHYSYDPLMLFKSLLIEKLS